MYMKGVTLAEYWPAKKIANKYEKQIRDAGILLERFREKERKRYKTNNLVSNDFTEKTK